MSLIIKSGENKKQTNKQAYTWAACILVSVFLVSIAVPLMGTKKEQSGQDYKERAYDLAQLPFSNDEATDALLFSDKYQDIGKKDLIGTLFSKEDKEKRQQEDKVSGVPAAPDAEYKEAEIQKENIARRRAAVEERRAAASAPNVPTSTGSLRAGGMVSGGGGSSGVSANIWRSDDKDRESGSAARGGSGFDGNKAQLLASIKSGRGTGFVDATMQSGAAAKNKNAEGAAAGAINAFQKGAGDKKAEAETDLEKKAEGLAIDPAALDDKLKGNTLNAGLDDKIEDKLKEKKEQKDKEQCKMMFESWDCALSMIGEKVLDMVTGAGKDALSSNWKNDKSDSKSDGSDKKS